MSSTRLTSPSDYTSFLSKYDTFLLDCDGVIWSGPHAIDGAKETITYLRSLGKNVIFVSNNASKSRPMYKKSFDKFGIDVSEDELFNSGYASALYLKKVLNFPSDKKVYLIGMRGLQEELEAVGIRYSGGEDPKDKQFIEQGDYSDVLDDPEVGAVLCGADWHVNYKKYAKAHTYLMNNPGCHFVLTNTDATFPSGGKFYPGSGAMSAPIVYSTKKTPTVIGKPHKHMMDAILATKKFDVARTVMVGDNLDTDITFGRDSGLGTLLVLTGVANESNLSGEGKHNVVPDYIIQSFGDLHKAATEGSS